jgi:hypothetical protein
MSGRFRPSMSVTEPMVITEDGVPIGVSHFQYSHPNACILAHGFMGHRHRPYLTSSPSTSVVMVPAGAPAACQRLSMT